MEAPRKKILLLENISLNARTMFEESGFEVEYLKQSLSKEELIHTIPSYAVVGVRYERRERDVMTCISCVQEQIEVGCRCTGGRDQSGGRGMLLHWHGPDRLQEGEPTRGTVSLS